MGQLSIIFIVGFICLFAYEYELPDSVETFHIVHSLFWNSLLTLIPILLALVITHIVPHFIKSDRPFARYVIGRIGSLRFVFEILCLATYLCNLYMFDLPIYINIQFSFFPFVELRRSFALFPLLVSLIGVRLVFHHINRSDDVRYSELLSFHIKFLLLPLIPLLIYLTTLDILVRLPEGILEFLEEHPYLLIGLLLPVLAGAYIFAPLLMRFMWKTMPLTDVVLQDRLEQMTKKSGTKYKDIVVWQTGSLLIANAAVAGTLHWNRRIFLTDTLLKYFTDDQIETIVAHELGHIRYKHIPTYVLFSTLYLLSYPLFLIFIEQPILNLLSTSFLENYPFISSAGSMLFFILYFIFGFRYVSRRFEYQADLYAVSLTNKPEAFISALERLALFNNIPRSVRRIVEFFNTHPSIHRRIEFVNQFIKGDTGISRYYNYLLETKILLILFPIFCAVILLLIL